MRKVWGLWEAQGWAEVMEASISNVAVLSNLKLRAIVNADFILYNLMKI